MRIVAGQYGGRRLSVPKGRDIRPTSDKVRGAIFNSLQSLTDLNGAHVLDVFCGTGALGLEALSRGAKRCTFVDKSRGSLDLAKHNAQDLGCFDDSAFIVSGAEKVRFGVCDPDEIPPVFDIVFCDPPYRKSLVIPCLNNLVEQAVIKNSGICVIETERDASPEWPDGFVVLKQKIYGDTCVHWLRYKISVA